MSSKNRSQVKNVATTAGVVASPEPEVIKQVTSELVYSVVVAQGRSVSLYGKTHVGGTLLDLADKKEYDWLKKIGFVVDA